MDSYKPLVNGQLMGNYVSRPVTLFAEVLENSGAELKCRASDGAIISVAWDTPQDVSTRFVSIVGVVEEPDRIKGWVVASVGESMDMPIFNELVVLSEQFPGTCHA